MIFMLCYFNFDILFFFFLCLQISNQMYVFCTQLEIFIIIWRYYEWTVQPSYKIIFYSYGFWKWFPHFIVCFIQLRQCFSAQCSMLTLILNVDNAKVAGGWLVFGGFSLGIRFITGIFQLLANLTSIAHCMLWIYLINVNAIIKSKKEFTEL